MARGNSRAQSEAGTIKRAETPGRRIRDAIKTLQGGSPSTKASDAQDILSKPRGNDEKYSIDMGDGRDDNKMTQAGKINLLEGTIDGRKIQSENTGVIDQIGVRSTSSPVGMNFDWANERANAEKGFVFAHDGKQVYALPHSWDKNDPAGTVGIFKGDVIKVNGKELTVVGSFDSSKRGLQAAAVAAGEAIGRDKGIKQTAVLLSYQSNRERAIERNLEATPLSVFSTRTIDTLNKGLPDGGAKKDGVEPFRF